MMENTNWTNNTYVPSNQIHWGWQCVTSSPQEERYIVVSQAAHAYTLASSTMDISATKQLYPEIYSKQSMIQIWNSNN